MKKITILILILIAMPLVFANECNETNNTKIITQQIIPEVIIDDGRCDVGLTLSVDKYIYDNGEKITITNNLTEKDHNFTITYWVEDEEGKIIKAKVDTNNLLKKQFTPNLNESKVLIIKNNLKYLDCNNKNNNTYNQVRIRVLLDKDPNPSLNITKIVLEKNDTDLWLKTNVSVYTGNYSSYEIFSFIENLTNKTMEEISGDYNKTTISFNTKIIKECLEEPKLYNFIVGSKDFRLERNFTITNSCTENINNQTQQEQNLQQTTNSTNSSENVINAFTNPITGKVIYNSSNIQAKNIAKYILMIILASVTVILLLVTKNPKKILEKTTQKWSSQLEQS